MYLGVTHGRPNHPAAIDKINGNRMFKRPNSMWPWFVLSQIAFGIVAGIVVSRQERISTWQPLPLAVREGVEAQGPVDDNGGEDAR